MTRDTRNELLQQIRVLRREQTRLRHEADKYMSGARLELHKLRTNNRQFHSELQALRKILNHARAFLADRPVNQS